MFGFHATILCELVYTETYQAYIMEVSKKSKYFRTLAHFSLFIKNRFLKDCFKMLNFPSFFKVFRMLQRANREKTAHCSMFFPHREFMSQKIFFKKEGYLLCLPGQPRNCYKFKIHSCTMFLIIRQVISLC